MANKISLLSSKDLNQLRQALEDRREISLTRTLGDVSVRACTSPAPAVWGCDMLVRLERREGGVYSSQYFRSVEEMMPYISFDAELYICYS